MKKNEVYILEKYGYVKITLDKILKERRLTKNKLATFAQVSPDLVNRYYNNKVSRVDLDILSRFCDILKCDITDILSYNKEK